MNEVPPEHQQISRTDLTTQETEIWM